MSKTIIVKLTKSGANIGSLHGGVRLQRLAVFKYNVVTKVGSFDINDTTTPAL